MNIQPSIDLKKVNLQTAVGYLVSLHDNMYQWNLLGIKVVGVAATEADIPTGEYEYGDAYEVGTEPPYDLYIYTRPDGVVHTEGYWFNTGKFPLPGPQGPKGDGLEQIYKWQNGYVTNVTYDTTEGAKVLQTTTVDYKDSTDGSTKQQQFGTTTTLPIVPGKYVSMDATSDNKKMEVKVDDTALALDYFKIDKSPQAAPSSPVYLPQTGGTSPMYVASDVIPTSIASRDSKGDCSFRYVKIDGISNKSSTQVISYWNIWRNIYDEAFTITKTSTDTGTLTVSDLEQIQAPGYYMVKYDNQLYYRYDPRTAPDGTLNFIHLDSIQDGESDYTMTGKCFSVTVSTRAWKVVDLNFGKDYTHNIYMDDAASNATIMFTVQSNKSTNYSPNTISELAAVVERIGFIPCVVEPGTGAVKAGYITADNTKFTVKTDAEYNYTFNQVTVQDTVS